MVSEAKEPIGGLLSDPKLEPTFLVHETRQVAEEGFGGLMDLRGHPIRDARLFFRAESPKHQHHHDDDDDDDDGGGGGGGGGGVILK